MVQRQTAIVKLIISLVINSNHCRAYVTSLVLHNVDRLQVYSYIKHHHSRCNVHELGTALQILAVS